MPNESAHTFPPRRAIAFLTMDCLDDFVSYDHLAVTPLNQLGWEVVNVSWRTTTPNWDEFAAVVIRSPWDYHHHVEEFLTVLDDIKRSAAKLINPLEIVRWNIDKTYLRDLDSAGVRIVPTVWQTSPTALDLYAALKMFSTDELVIKPTIGAGANDTFRWRGSDPIEQTQSITDCYRNRAAMIQPFLGSVVGIGEWSLIYFGGEFSHAVLKTPKAGDFRVQEEHGSRLRAAAPTAEQFQVAEAALDAIPQATVYARVDLAELPTHEPAIMELELIEPSLYFPYDDESVNRFARALDDTLGDSVSIRAK